jgi:hypothetical protein
MLKNKVPYDVERLLKWRLLGNFMEGCVAHKKREPLTFSATNFVLCAGHCNGYEIKVIIEKRRNSGWRSANSIKMVLMQTSFDCVGRT